MSAPDEANQLVDAIYEAGASPDLWPAAINQISERIGGVGGLLFGAREGYQGTVFTPQHAEIFDRFFNEGWAAQDPTLPRGFELNHPGFITDHDMLDDETIATHAVYDFYREVGIGFRAASIIPNPSGDMVAFSFLRHQKDGPVPRGVIAYLDRLRPHLARASMLSFRLGFAQAKAQADAMQAIGLPAAVVRVEGRLLAANALFEGMMPFLFQDRRTRIALCDAAADALLADVFGSFGVGKAARSIAIARSDSHVAMVLHIVPIRGAAHDVFTKAAALLVVTPVDRALVPTAEVLQGLFDLTAAEARVARGIGEARSVQEIALGQGVSRETVRSHLKAILAKTGLTRQSELVSLLAGTGRIA